MPIQISLSNAIGALQGLAGGGPGPGPGPGYTPPLDAYPATAAYSVRKLSSTYSGDALRVRRTVSPFDEQDIGFDSNGDLDTAAIVAFGGSDSLGVSIWYDQTGNGHDATQTSTNDQPLIYNGLDVETIGGLVSLTDNGVNGSIAMSIPPFGTSSSTAAVFSLVTPLTDRGLVWNAQSGYAASEASGALSIYQGSFVAGTLIKPNEQRLQSYLFGATDYGYVNGTLGVSGNAGSNALGNNSNMFIGGQAVNFREVAAMQEIMIYISDETSARPTIESNINSYFQISNLPDYTSGFLADYPDAAIAYSVRKLSNTAIKCMRVRRFVPPYDEQDIGFTAGGDLDEAAIVAFGGSDELLVSAWYDQSGQSRHATQINPNSQPQIYNGTAVITENGKPAVDFISNSGRSLNGPTFSNNSIMGFCVAREVVKRGTIWGLGGGVMYKTLELQYWDSELLLAFKGDGTNYDDVRSPTLTDDNAQHLVTLSRFSNALKTFVDGTADINTTDSYSADSGALGFATRNTQGQLLLQEAIFYETDQDTAGNRTGIEGNIMTYYNIP